MSRPTFAYIHCTTCWKWEWTNKNNSKKLHSLYSCVLVKNSFGFKCNKSCWHMLHVQCQLMALFICSHCHSSCFKELENLKLLLHLHFKGNGLRICGTRSTSWSQRNSISWSTWNTRNMRYRNKSVVIVYATRHHINHRWNHGGSELQSVNFCIISMFM